MRASLPQVQAPRPRTSTRGVYFLVAVPTLLALACAILILVYQQSAFDVAMGVMLVLICAALGAGAALTIAGLQMDRRLAALQLDFVSKVSHELKTPLTSIRMFVDTLQLGRVQDEEKVAQCLDVISKETDRLSELIGRLLSWGAMEAGAFSVDLRPTDPRRIIESAVEAFEPSALAAQAEVSVDVADDLPQIAGDERSLVDTLLNLLTNAVRYGRDDKKIWITAVRRENNGVRIAVRDNGMGIELKDQSRIFERFYRADERYTRQTGGTGLGLAIARHIVLVHRGTIDVTSKVGEGSTFTISLPPLSEALESQVAT